MVGILNILHNYELCWSPISIVTNVVFNVWMSLAHRFYATQQSADHAFAVIFLGIFALMAAGSTVVFLKENLWFKKASTAALIVDLTKNPIPYSVLLAFLEIVAILLQIRIWTWFARFQKDGEAANAGYCAAASTIGSLRTSLDCSYSSSAIPGPRARERCRLE